MDEKRECTCTPMEIRRYLKRISGPLLDRMDMHVHVPRLEYQEMISKEKVESSFTIRQRVTSARNLQQQRLKRYGLHCNAQMGHKHVKALCALTAQAQKILEQTFIKLNLSARGYDRILKVAKTIADLAQCDIIQAEHIAEAVHLRNDTKL